MSTSGSSAIPDGLVLRRHLELAGRRKQALARRVLVVVLAIIPVLALLNFFGQRPVTSTAESEAASLHVEAPTRLRGGLLFQARFEIVPRQDLPEVVLVLDPGWTEGMQVNSVTPEPLEERSREGRLLLGYGRLPANDELVVRMQFQVDPTNVGRRSQSLSLESEDVPVAQVSRTVTVFP